jgi:hypothetical protein
MGAGAAGGGRDGRGGGRGRLHGGGAREPGRGPPGAAGPGAEPAVRGRRARWRGVR